MRIAQLPSKRKNNILLIILVLGLPLVVFAAYQAVKYITNASADSQPQNVLISTLTTSSATITWTTDSQVKGTVALISDGEEQSPVLDSRGNSRRYTHYVELSGLEPSTTYSFVIISDSQRYTEEDGNAFTFQTASISATTPTPNPVHGSVSGVSGDDVVIFVSLKDKSTYPVSATIPSGGSWIVDLSALRKVSDRSLVIATESTNLVLVAVTGTGKGDVLEGSYSDLFDSNGKLLDTQILSSESNSNIYSYFSTAAMLQAYEEPDTTDPDTDTDTDTDTNTDTDTDTNTDTDTPSSRIFRLVSDLEWVDMVSGTTISADTGEETVQITNLTDTGFTVVWVSQSQEQGEVNYGTSSSALSLNAVDERDGLSNQGEYYVHSVELSSLQPETTYYFDIVSGEDTYDNDGDHYSVDTFATLSSAPPYESITGDISNLPSDGEGVVIAYIKDMDDTGSTGNSLKISTIVDENAKWILSIADTRTSDGSAYYEYTDDDEMYFSILSTVNSTAQNEGMEGITEDDVSLTIGSTSTDEAVEKLSDYGVLGASTSVLGTSDDTTQTPKTGVLDNMPEIIIISIVLVTISSITAISLQRRKTNHRMKDNI